MTIQANESMTKLTHPFVFKCDVIDCYYRTAHNTEEEAANDKIRHDQSGQCPSTGGKTYLMEEVDERGQRYTALHMGKSLAEKLWDDLDEAFAKLKTAQNEGDQFGVELAKGQCQAFSISLQHMLAHYYPHTDDVTREAIKRYKIQHEGAEFEPTPGYQFNPPPPGTDAFKKAQKKMMPEDKKPRGNADQLTKGHVSLSDEVDQKIRNALKTGLFEDKDLAETFSVTEEYIRKLRSTS